MHRREFLKAGMLAAATETIAFTAARETPSSVSSKDCHTFVYGSTPGGVAAAVEAARRGNRVILACPKARPGGMAASGLSTTDAVRPQLFGGLVAEFIAKVRQHYQKRLAGDPQQYKLIHDGWFYEPSVAEMAFRQLIEAERPRLEWLPGQWLWTAERAGSRIVAVELEDAVGRRQRITAHTFIDGTYEGDLAGLAKVPYRVGREGRDEYGEPFAGIHYMNWQTGKQILTADTGEPSLAIQAFCARSIFTDDPRHRVPIEKPATYEQHLADFLPLLDDFAAGRRRSWSWGVPLPNRKYQLNGDIEGLTSLNCPGVSWSWPEANRHHRQRLEQFHVDHAAGLIWFLQHEPRVPEKIRQQLAPLGLHDQEFSDTGHWPWQIYVRQGRRIEGRYVVTQRNFMIDSRTGRSAPLSSPVIAIGEHRFDVHPCHDRRFAVEGFMEGVLWYPKKAFGPAQPGQVPYEAMSAQRGRQSAVSRGFVVDARGDVRVKDGAGVDRPRGQLQAWPQPPRPWSRRSTWPRLIRCRYRRSSEFRPTPMLLDRRIGMGLVCKRCVGWVHSRNATSPRPLWRTNGRTVLTAASFWLEWVPPRPAAWSWHQGGEVAAEPSGKKATR